MTASAIDVSLWERMAADLGLLEREMEVVLGVPAERLAATCALAQRYDLLREEAERFAPALGDLLMQWMEVPVRISATRELSWAGCTTLGDGMLGSQAEPRRGVLTVQEQLADPAGAARRARAYLAQGGDVFAAFQGRWRGTWYGREAGATGSQSDQTYDHHWEPTRPRGVLRMQRVLMGPFHSRDQAMDGSTMETLGDPVLDSAAPLAAVNAVDPRTGRIAGAVDVDRGSGHALRPHVGYFVDAHTLIWVAQERVRSGGGGDIDWLCSCFYEHVEARGSYLILGVQFSWVRPRGGREGQIALERLMGGEYRRPRPAVG